MLTLLDKRATCVIGFAAETASGQSDTGLGHRVLIYLFVANTKSRHGAAKYS